MAFIAGFNKSSILRLKLTFKELSQRAAKVIKNSKLKNNNNIYILHKFYNIFN